MLMPQLVAALNLSDLPTSLTQISNLNPSSLTNGSSPQPSPTPTVQNPQDSTSNPPLPPINTIDSTIPSNVPIQPPPLQHHMQTCSKNGIFKPKVSYATQVDYTTTEPTSYTNASKHRQWCTAMDEEFQALQK